MYKLSVGALFRNESHSMKEWLEHYLLHGVEHFYLINDDSTDSFMEILQPYIDAKIVTLFNAEWKRYLGRQRDMYTHYILPRLNDKETTWLLMVDLDEYMWSPMNINLCHVLDMCHSFGQIQVKDILFGSSGHVVQPKYIVKNFTQRAVEPRNCYKYFVRSGYNFTHLNVHHATFADKADELNKFVILDSQYFVLNHYCIQSRQFWNEVKCTRNDSDHYRVRTMEEFDSIDYRDVDDTQLAEQNEVLITSGKI